MTPASAVSESHSVPAGASGCIRRFAALAVALCLAMTAEAAATGRLSVALVSGSDHPVYETDQTLQKLKHFLELYYSMDCVLVLPSAQDGGFENLAALREVDAAVFFVRRKTPPPAALAELRAFFDSGRGIVALGPTSHAWENWPTFDLDVLGATYGGSWAEGRDIGDLRLRAHPILAGSEDYRMSHYVYNYTQFADDVQVLIEAGLEGKFMPVAWTRERKGSRIFHLAPARKDEFEKVSYLRIVANAVLWSARREIPGVGTRIQRTWMPDAHPAAFAVGFPEGLNFCFDAELCELAYAWEGDYADLHPTVTGKFPRDARLKGEIFFRAQSGAWRAGTQAVPARVRFKGYTVRSGIPEFHYEIDGVAVTETVRPQPGRGGLVRHFQVRTADGTLSFRPDRPENVVVDPGPARLVDGHVQVPANATVQFIVNVPRP